MSETTHRPRRTECSQCGVLHRGKFAICVACRKRTNGTYPDQEIALTGGEWVRKGSIRVWVGPVPAETPDRNDDLIERLTRNLDYDAEIIVNKKATPTFCGCGCWLLSDTEDCPACKFAAESVTWLDWAIEAERHHNRVAFSKAVA